MKIWRWPRRGLFRILPGALVGTLKTTPLRSRLVSLMVVVVVVCVLCGVVWVVWGVELDGFGDPTGES